jgi:AcrR family transcriptional regulator
VVPHSGNAGGGVSDTRDAPTAIEQREQGEPAVGIRRRAVTGEAVVAGAEARGGRPAKDPCRLPRLRADASRNRERIVAAAREAIVEYGADVPMDEVARRAGVGNATVYRHFADRRELTLAVFRFVLGRLADLTEAALAEEADPFDALRRFVRAAADERMGALCPMMTDDYNWTDVQVIETKLRVERGIEEIMERARRSGSLRDDVSRADLMMAIVQLTRPLPGKLSVCVTESAHRHLQLILDGLAGPARSTLPGTPLVLPPNTLPAGQVPADGSPAGTVPPGAEQAVTASMPT